MEKINKKNIDEIHCANNILQKELLVLVEEQVNTDRSKKKYPEFTCKKIIMKGNAKV